MRRVGDAWWRTRRLTEAFASRTSTNCARNDEYDACGTLYPVSDYLPKVVAVVDSAGKLAGVGEYDVFGRVNEVAVRKDVPPRPAPAGSWMPSGTYRQGYSNYVLASLKQPWRTANLRVMKTHETVSSEMAGPAGCAVTRSTPARGDQRPFRETAHERTHRGPAERA